ncbi:MAG: transglycosylase SLT domain-containing protein [bacterium]|nr:transglycosylase SLT domain-containing protein [bacterium]
MLNSLSKIFLLVAVWITLGLTAPSGPSESIKKYGADEIRQLGCDTMAHVIFWRRIMNLHQDSCLINVHSCRMVLTTYPATNWNTCSVNQRLTIADSFRRLSGIYDSSRVVGTMGKSFFYVFEKVAPKVPLGIEAFEKNGVNGWYAKAILLIESPNQLQKSSAGAYGPFQLMKGVARNYGLKVNKKMDERANFNRSAYAASQLIKTICIPYTKSMLDARGIVYNEHDLWFRLIVMHVYNAGAGNVSLALNSIQYPAEGMGLIKQLWTTSAGRFQTSSQNYSQLVLAAFLEYDERVDSKAK